jgi:hypothetical protein
MILVLVVRVKNTRTATERWWRVETCYTGN